MIDRETRTIRKLDIIRVEWIDQLKFRLKIEGRAPMGRSMIFVVEVDFWRVPRLFAAIAEQWKSAKAERMREIDNIDGVIHPEMK